MKAKNGKIRQYAQNSRVRLWEISDKLGITDTNLSKKLRYELPEQETRKIIRIIDNIAAEYAAEQKEEGEFNG